MRILDKIKEVFKKELPVEAPMVKPTGYEFREYYLGDGGSKKTEYLAEMRSWVFACVSAIADEIARIPLHLYEMKKNYEVEEINDHPILDLLYKVNDYTTRFDFMWITASYLELTGECYWFLEKDGEKVSSIYFLPSDRVKPVIKNNAVIAYEYSYNNNLSWQRVTIPAELVIFLKYPNPADPARGLGTLQAAAKTVDTDNFSEEWNKKFFENSARPDGILNVKVNNLGKEQLEQLKDSIKKQYQGIDKAHKLMVLFGDMEYKNTGYSQKDMDFLAQMNFTRDKILGIFRVPKSILAQTDQVNYAAANTANYVFSRWTVKPKMERLIQQINEFLIPLFVNSENIYLDYEDPVKEDVTEKTAFYASGIQNGYLTPNEVRQREGLDEVENGDYVYLPFSLAPINRNGKTETPEEDKGLRLKVKKSKVKKVSQRVKDLLARNKDFRKEREIKNTLKDLIKKSIQKEIKDKKNGIVKEDKPVVYVFNEEEKKKYWEKKDIITVRFMPQVRETASKFFNDQGKRIIKGSKDISGIINFDVKKETKKMVVATLDIFSKIFKASGDNTFDILGIDMQMDITREDVKRLLKTETRKMSLAVNEETDIILKGIIEQGQVDGLSASEIKKNILDKFTDFEEYRADRIARSETVRYNVAATEQAFEDSGIVEKKEWVVNPGACELCQPLSGETKDLGELFEDTDYGGQVPPLHANCRCYIAPVFSNKKVPNFNTKTVDKLVMKGINDIDDKLEKMEENFIKEIEGQIKDGIKKESEKNKTDILNKIDSVIYGNTKSTNETEIDSLESEDKGK
jgi:HK97 family phage portal protein